MSSSDTSHNKSTSNGQSPAAPEDPDEEASTPSEASVETIECPNCGHEFADNYCPECGQEADPSASVLDVIGGFFRELVDVEHGFWPTFVGLTLRPGKVLRQYLSGVRAGLASPGRYLLAAIVVDVIGERFLAWIGATEAAWSDSESTSTTSGGAETAEGFDEVIDMAREQLDIIFVGPQARIFGALLVTGLFTVLLYRLFQDTFGRMGEALAVASFLVAHMLFLGRAVDLLHTPLASLYVGHPVDTPAVLGLPIVFGYVGFASYRGFGPGWKSALKGTFSIICAFVEVLSVTLIAGMAYAAGLILLYPDRYVPTGSTAGEELVGAALFGFVVAIPLLLHAGVELYLRYRE